MKLKERVKNGQVILTVSDYLTPGRRVFQSAIHWIASVPFLAFAAYCLIGGFVELITKGGIWFVLGVFAFGAVLVRCAFWDDPVYFWGKTTRVIFTAEGLRVRGGAENAFIHRNGPLVTAVKPHDRAWKGGVYARSFSVWVIYGERTLRAADVIGVNRAWDLSAALVHADVASMDLTGPTGFFR